MEDKIKDYQKLLCEICENRKKKKKSSITIYKFQERISIKCLNYKFEQKDNV